MTQEEEAKEQVVISLTVSEDEDENLIVENEETKTLLDDDHPWAGDGMTSEEPEIVMASPPKKRGRVPKPREIFEVDELATLPTACRHRIKLDYGWKTLLRGMRQCLREAMDNSTMFQGRHHWSD